MINAQPGVLVRPTLAPTPLEYASSKLSGDRKASSESNPVALDDVLWRTRSGARLDTRRLWRCRLPWFIRCSPNGREWAIVRSLPQTLYFLGGWDYSETVACRLSRKLTHERNALCPVHRSPPHHPLTRVGLVCLTVDARHFVSPPRRS